MAKSSPRRVTSYINGKEMEAFVTFVFFRILRPAKQPPMFTTRTYSPLPTMISVGDIFCTDSCGPRDLSPSPHTCGVCLLFAFSSKERDVETGLSYFGARYYSSDLSVWLAVDPMSGKYPYQSSYVYCANNPMRVTDPNGMWEWDASGNLVAQPNDNSYTLATFLGTSQKNAMTILSRSGVIADKNGMLNLKSGQVLSKNTLYIDHGSGDFPTISNTTEAIAHYYSGHGKPVNVGFLAALAVINSNKFKSKHNKITTKGSDSHKGYFMVDLTSTSPFFHIGRTGVDYSITEYDKTSAVTYTLFTNTDKIPKIRLMDFGTLILLLRILWERFLVIFQQMKMGTTWNLEERPILMSYANLLFTINQ